MKKNKQISLNESLGVPDNLIEVAWDLYDKIIERLKEISQYRLSSGFHTDVEVDYTIGSKRMPYKIYMVDVTVNIKEHNNPKYDDIVILGAGIEGRFGELIEKDRFMKMSPHGDDLENVVLELNFAINPNNFEYEPKVNDILNYMMSKKKEYIKILPHELKHLYDLYVKRHQKTPTKETVSYQQFNNYRMRVSVMDELTHQCYYFHVIENRVRSTELLAELKGEGATKLNFREVFENSLISKKINYATKLKYSDFIKNLYVDKDLRKLYNTSVPSPFQFMYSFDKFIEDLLQGYTKNFESHLNLIISHNFEKDMTDFDSLSKDEKYAYNSLLSDYRKSNGDYKTFISYLIDKNRNAARNVYKKIVRVYDNLPDK